MSENSSAQSVISVGVISRLDIGGEGTRLNLITAGLERLRNEGATFIVIAGGLVDGHAMEDRLKAEQVHYRTELEEKSRYKPKEIKELVAAYREKFVARWVKWTLKALPELKHPVTGERLSHNIVTSAFYDGKIGKEIAYRLAEKREDIRYRGEKLEDAFHLRRVDKWMVVRVPQKAPWRSDYYSTSASREVKDSLKSRSVEAPDFFVVGCTGSSIFKPAGGEAEIPIFTVPVLHKLKSVRGSENQIGVRLFTVTNGGKAFIAAKNFCFKDLVTQERRSVRIPPELKENERRIVERIVGFGDQTVSSIAEELGVSKAAAEKSVKGLVKAMPRRISFDSASRQLDFTPAYMRDELCYQWPEEGRLIREAIVSFVCGHAGHGHLNHRMWSDDLARVVLEKDASGIACMGDLVGGIKHDLIIRGEIYAGMNVTQQEKLAAFLTSQSLLKPFYVRMDKELAACKETPSLDALKEMIARAYPWFWYIPGNHCKWVVVSGVEPLVTFRYAAIDFITVGMRDFLQSRNAYASGFLHPFVQSRFVQGATFTLPRTGLTVFMCHPEMGRTLTLSIRPQQVLGRKDAREAQIALEGNFHVGVTVEEWRPGAKRGAGQRVVQQVGTLLSRTEFEDGKMKDCDQHFGSLTVWAKDGRILASEPAFHGPSVEEEPLSNDNILAGLMEKYRAPVPPSPKQSA